MASAWVGSPMRSCQPLTEDLAGDEGGGALGAIFEDLEQIAALGRRERSEPPIVDDEQVSLGQAGKARVYEPSPRASSCARRWRWSG
jgi:hypothetical protein